MVKKVFKILGIVLASTVVLILAITGVLYLQGKFKDPYVEPEHLYFDAPDNTLNVTYYGDNVDVLTGDYKSNIYSFVVRAYPEDVTELDCSMMIVSGSPLITICDSAGNPLDNALQSTVKINSPIYFKINDSFNSSANDYEITNGQVKFSFISENNLCNADLNVMIDRQISDVSLFDYNNPQNNTLSGSGTKFPYSRYEIVNMLPRNWGVDDFYTRNGNSYVIVEKSAEFKTNTIYYKNVGGEYVSLKLSDFNAEAFYEYDSTISSYKLVPMTDDFDPTKTYYEANYDLHLAISANTNYLLNPIFAPLNSNDPYLNSDGKMCDIFIKNANKFENVKETDFPVIQYNEETGECYFNGSEAGTYDLYIVTYPTFEAQQKFLDEFTNEENEYIILQNQYSVSKHVILEVENSGVSSVTFNDNASLNLPFDLFKENKVAVNSDMTGDIINLGIKMFNNTGSLVSSRYNQIEFLNDDAYMNGNVVIKATNSDKLITFLAGGSVRLEGFSDNLNGTKTWTGGLDTVSKTFRISINGLNNSKVEISFRTDALDEEGLYRLNNRDDFNVTETDSTPDGIVSTFHCDQVVILKVENGADALTKNYSIGTLKPGSYLVFYDETNLGRECANENFEITHEGFGKEKVFTIRPKTLMTELDLYCLIINDDYGFVYTDVANAIGVSITPEETSYSVDNSETLTGLKLKYYLDSDGELELQRSQIDVLKYVNVTNGSYSHPLMFVEKVDGETPKVLTISQVHFTLEGKTYYLVGTFDENGNFINQVIPRVDAIGVERIYVVFLKYSYGINSSEELVKSITESYADKIYYSGKTIDHNGENVIVTSAEIVDEEGVKKLVVYFNKADGTTDEFEVTENILSDVTSDIFNNSDLNNSIELNIQYAEKIDSSEQREPASELAFEYSFTTEGNKGIQTDTSGKQTSVTIKEGTSLSGNSYLEAKLIGDAYIKSPFLKTITNPDGDNNITEAINSNFTIGMMILNSSQALDRKVKLNYDGTAFKFNDELLDAVFKIDSIVYFDEAETKSIRINFTIQENPQDIFENYVFRFYIGYGALTDSESCNLIVESTAITTYYFRTSDDTPVRAESPQDLTIGEKIFTKEGESFSQVNENVDLNNWQNYYTTKASTNNYMLVYIPSVEENGGDAKYKLTPYLVSKDDYESYKKNAKQLKDILIKLAKNGEITGLVDDGTFNVEVGNHDTNSLWALPVGFNTSEFDFRIDSSDQSVIKVDGNKIQVLKAGSCTLTITNSSKTSVKNEIQVAVLGDGFNLSSNKETNEYSTNKVTLNGESESVFDLTYDSKSIFNSLIDGKPVVDFEITNLETGFSFEVTNDADKKTYHIKDAEGSDVITIKYDDESKSWVMERTEKHVLTALTFRLVCKSDFAGEVSTNISYLSPVKIAKNPNSPLNSLDKITYYKGTQLVLSRQESSTDNQDALFILEDKSKDTFEEGSTLFKLQYRSTTEEEWKDTDASGFKLVLNKSDLENGDYQGRVYYNDNKYMTFNFEVRDNVHIVIAKGDNGLIDAKNPLDIAWNDAETSQDLKDIIKAYKYKEEQEFTNYNNLTNAEEISDISITINNANDAPIEISENSMSLKWSNYVGEKTFAPELKIHVNDKDYNETLYINVKSNYKITQKKDLPHLETLETINIDMEKISEYFEITGGKFTTIKGIKSLEYVDLQRDAANPLDCSYDEAGNLTCFEFKTGKESEGYFKIVFVVTDGENEITHELTNENGLYNVHFDEFRLKRKENKLYVENQIKFTDIYDVDFTTISSIKVIGGTHTTIYGNSEVTGVDSNLGLLFANLGIDYVEKLGITIEFTDGVVVTYEASLDILNKTHASVDYKFKDLVLSNNDLGDLKQYLDENQMFDVALAGEKISDLADRFIVKEIRNTDGVDAEEKNSATLQKIELMGVAGFTNSNLITIDGTIIRFGDIKSIGYALFRLTATDKTICYYLVKLTPKIVSSPDGDYSSVINQNGERATKSIETTYDASKSIKDIIDNAQIRSVVSSISEILLRNSTISIYLMADESQKAGIIANYETLENKIVLNDAKFVDVANPTTFRLSVVLKKDNAIVNICDFIVTLIPNVTITTSDGTQKVDDANRFLYQTGVKFSYAEDSDNIFDISNFLTVKKNGAEGNLSVTGVKIENATRISDDINSIVSIEENKLKLLKNISSTMNFDLVVTYNTGLIVTIKVTFEPFKNSNTTTQYSLGFNDTQKTFNYKINLKNLIKEYNGSINIESELLTERNSSGSLGDEGLSELNYTDVAKASVLTDTLRVTLIDIVGSPVYTFTITINPKYQVEKAKGGREENPIVTQVTNQEKELPVSQIAVTSANTESGTNTIKFNDTDVIVYYVGETLNITDVQSDTLNNLLTSRTDGNIVFNHTASEFSGQITITIGNDINFDLFVKVSKSYSVIKNYRTSNFERCTSVSDINNYQIYKYEGEKYIPVMETPTDWNTNYTNYYKDTINYESVKVSSSVDLTKFLADLPTIDSSDKTMQNSNHEVNSHDFVLNSRRLSIYSDGKVQDDLNFGDVKYRVYYGDNILDSGNTYHKIDKNTLTFTTAGDIELEIYDDYGLNVRYKIRIQDDAEFYDNIVFNSENTATGETGEMPYYSISLDELKAGYKLATLKYNPNGNLNFTIYYKLTGSDTSNLDNYISYSLDNTYDIMLKLDDEVEITSEMLTFEIKFVTINGVNVETTLYVVKFKLDYAMEQGSVSGDLTPEYVYANREGIDLKSNASNSKTRLAINGKTEYNSDTDKFVLVYQGAENLTDHLTYEQNSQELVVVVENESHHDFIYASSQFDLFGVAYDTTIVLNYDLYYVSGSTKILIEKVKYRIVVQNDIEIKMNGFSDTGNRASGDVYLSSYNANGSNITLDLINNNTGSKYSNAYIIYRDLKTNSNIFEGKSVEGKDIATYMQFELDEEETTENYKSTTISEDGKLSLPCDSLGRIAIKVTAKYSPNYSRLFVMNIHPTITVDQAYNENQTYNGTDGFNAGADIQFISNNTTNKNGYMFKISKQEYDSKLALQENNAGEIQYKIQFALRTSLTQTITTWTNYNGTTDYQTLNSGSTLSIKLPKDIPVSDSNRFILTYKLTIKSTISDNEYICNYLVKNDSKITIKDNYTSKSISATDSTLFSPNGGGTKFDLAKLFDGLNSFSEGVKVEFRNCVDETGEIKTHSFDSVTKTDSEFSINLSHSSTLFYNSMTFDIVIKSEKDVDLFISYGWKISSDNPVTLTHHKKLTDIFTDSELGDDLVGKEFCYVGSSAPSSASSLSSQASDIQVETTATKTISRNGTTYEIYKVTLSNSSTSSFYGNRIVSYYVKTDKTQFIEITTGYYVSQIIKRNDIKDGSYTIDIANYIKIFDGSNWSETEGRSASSISITTTEGDLHPVGTSITIPQSKLAGARYVFDIVITYNGVTRSTRVVITIEDK